MFKTKILDMKKNRLLRKKHFLRRKARVYYLAKKFNKKTIVLFIIVLQFLFLEFFFHCFMNLYVSPSMVKFMYYGVVFSVLLLLYASFAAKKYLHNQNNYSFGKSFIHLLVCAFLSYFAVVGILLIILMT